MRARAAARLQRLQEQQQQQQETLRQLCVRRQRAVENWEREEKRLRRERKRKEKEDAEKEPDRRVVRFADEVFVTEIPLKPADPIPKPVASPIGVAVSESAIARQRLDQIMANAKELDRLLAITNAPRLARTTQFVPVDGNWGNLSDEDDDDDDDDDDPEYDPSVDDESGGVKVTVVTPRKAQSAVVEVKVDKPSNCSPDRKLQQKKARKRARIESLDNEAPETPEHMPIESPAEEDSAATPLKGISSSGGPAKRRRERYLTIRQSQNPRHIKLSQP